MRASSAQRVGRNSELFRPEKVQLASYGILDDSPTNQLAVSQVANMVNPQTSQLADSVSF